MMHYPALNVFRWDKVLLINVKVLHFSHNDEQPELNLENDYPNKTGYNLKTNSSISIL